MATTSAELPVAARLAMFGLGLVAAFGAAFGLGQAIGPIDDEAPSSPIEQPSDHDGDGDHGSHESEG